MASPRVAIYDPGLRLRDDLSILFSDAGAQVLEAASLDAAKFAGQAVRGQAELILVCVADPEDPAANESLELLKRLTAQSSESLLAVVLARPSGTMTIAARLAGANEVLTEPVPSEQVAQLVDRLRRLRGEEPGRPRGAVLAIAGAAGGIGATLVAVNLACLAARDPACRTLLVDLDLALGDADALLDLLPDFTVADWLKQAGKLTPAELLHDVARRPSGLFLLPRPQTQDQVAGLGAVEMSHALALARRAFSLTVCDLSKGFGPLDLAVLDACDRVLLLTGLDVVALRSTLRLLESLQNRGIYEDRIDLAASAAYKPILPFDVARAESILGRTIRWRLPGEPAAAEEARLQGMPLVELAPHAGLSLDLAEMADELLAELVPARGAR